MAKKRRSISKKVRFEVFKRDHFRCQYCGRTPPVVTLELDHVMPVASGGDNSLGNLVASCKDCNQGKGATKLSAVPRPLSVQMKERREHAEQLAAYNEFLLEQQSLQRETESRLGVIWYNLCRSETEEPGQFEFGLARRGSMRTFLKSLAMGELVEAMHIAHEKFPVATYESNDERTWKYFCGICWTKIKQGDTDGTDQEP